jgi:hypothetical protein
MKKVSLCITLNALSKPNKERCKSSTLPPESGEVQAHTVFTGVYHF